MVIYLIFLFISIVIYLIFLFISEDSSLSSPGYSGDKEVMVRSDNWRYEHDSDGQFVLKLIFMEEGHLVKCHGVKVVDFKLIDFLK